MKKFLVLAAILILAAACSEPAKLDVKAAAATLNHGPTAEELAKTKEAEEEMEREFKMLADEWETIQAGPPATPDWKAELDGKSASDTVLCQTIGFNETIQNFEFRRKKASARNLTRIRFIQEELDSSKKAGIRQFINLALENAKSGRTVYCPEAGTWEPYLLTETAIESMKQYDVTPKDLGLDVAGIRAIELAAIKSRTAELRKTMYEPNREGSGMGLKVFLGALDKGFSGSDLGLTEEEIQKMRDVEGNS